CIFDREAVRIENSSFYGSLKPFVGDDQILAAILFTGGNVNVCLPAPAMPINVDRGNDCADAVAYIVQSKRTIAERGGRTAANGNGGTGDNAPVNVADSPRQIAWRTSGTAAAADQCNYSEN